MTLPGGSLSRQKKGKGKKAIFGKWHRFRKWGLRSGIALAGIVVILGGFLIAKGYFNLGKIFRGGGDATALQENVSPDLLKGEGDGRVNILLLGRGGEGHDGADLTDTIILASVDPVNKSAALVSIPRDLWVTTSGYGSSKINAVFANAKNKALRSNPGDKAAAENAGVNAIKEEVTDVLGVPIHYYGMVDFQAFKQAVDTVGGVTIDVPEDLIDQSVAWENNGSPVLARKGVQTFNGQQALLYVRSRHGSARGDFDRAERQRLFITALSQKILSAGTYTNPVKLTQLMDTFGNHVSTDFSIKDAVRLMEIGRGIDGTAISSIGLADPPNVLVQTSNINGQSVVIPKAGVGDFGPIHEFIRSKLIDGYILKEAPKLAVLNGTTKSGLATTKAEQLKTYGYNVVVVGDAPTQSYQKTVLVDLTNGQKPYTRNYLERRFDVKTTTEVPEGIQSQEADFVIILGSNEATDS